VPVHESALAAELLARHGVTTRARLKRLEVTDRTLRTSLPAGRTASTTGLRSHVRSPEASSASRPPAGMGTAQDAQVSGCARVDRGTPPPRAAARCAVATDQPPASQRRRETPRRQPRHEPTANRLRRRRPAGGRRSRVAHRTVPRTGVLHDHDAVGVDAPRRQAWPAWKRADRQADRTAPGVAPSGGIGLRVAARASAAAPRLPIAPPAVPAGACRRRGHGGRHESAYDRGRNLRVRANGYDVERVSDVAIDYDLEATVEHLWEVLQRILRS
jgi:hypothetical protein